MDHQVITRPTNDVAYVPHERARNIGHEQELWLSRVVQWLFIKSPELIQSFIKVTIQIVIPPFFLGLPIRSLARSLPQTPLPMQRRGWYYAFKLVYCASVPMLFCAGLTFWWQIIECLNDGPQSSCLNPAIRVQNIFQALALSFANTTARLILPHFYLMADNDASLNTTKPSDNTHYDDVRRILLQAVLYLPFLFFILGVIFTGSILKAIQTLYLESSTTEDNLTSSIWSFGLLNILWLWVGGYWAYKSLLGRIKATKQRFLV